MTLTQSKDPFLELSQPKPQPSLKYHLPEIRKFAFTRGKEPELPLKLVPRLSAYIWGLEKRALTVIGSRTSEGKSAVGMQFAYDLAMQGKKVLFLSLETTIEKMGIRLFCLHSKYSNVKAFRGGIPDDAYIFDKFEKDVGDIPLSITDMVGRNWEDVEKFITEYDYQPEAVFVDYIQTIADREGKNKLETINEYIRNFRELAIRKDFAGIICSQINRTIAENKDNAPQLHQLKGTGFLEEHADVVFLLSWPWKYLKHAEGKIHTDDQMQRFNFYIAKNKEGMTGYQKLRFTPEYYLFEDWIERAKGDYNGEKPQRGDESWEE